MTHNSNNYNNDNNGKDKFMKKQQKKYVYKPIKEFDLIEMVAYLHENGSAKIENELTRELSKSRRTVYRMIEKICPFDVISLSPASDFRTVVHFNHNLSNRNLDHAYATTGKFPALYVFLKGLKKNDIVLISDIQKWLSCDEKAAIATRNEIMNTTYVVDFEISDDDPYWFE